MLQLPATAWCSCPEPLQCFLGCPEPLSHSLLWINRDLLFILEVGRMGLHLFPGASLSQGREENRGKNSRVGVLHVASPGPSPHHGPHPIPGLPSLIISEHGRTEVEILLREPSTHRRSTPILIMIFYHQPLSSQFHASLALPDERISCNSLTLRSAFFDRCQMQLESAVNTAVLNHTW